MSKLGLEQLLISSVLASVILAVGCADGTRHDSPMRKIPATGQLNPLQKMTTGQVAAASATEANIQAQADALAKGNDVASTSLIAPGSYALNAIIVSYKNMPAGKAFVQFLGGDQVNADSAQLTPVADVLTSGNVAGITDSGQQIFIPLKFTVGADKVLTPTSQRLLLSKIGPGTDKTKLALVDQFIGEQAANIVRRLDAAAIDKGIAAKTTSMQTIDANGTLQIKVDLTGELAASAAGTTVVRSIFFRYAVSATDPSKVATQEKKPADLSKALGADADAPADADAAAADAPVTFDGRD